MGKWGIFIAWYWPDTASARREDNSLNPGEAFNICICNYSM